MGAPARTARAEARHAFLNKQFENLILNVEDIRVKLEDFHISEVHRLLDQLELQINEVRKQFKH